MKTKKSDISKTHTAVIDELASIAMQGIIAGVFSNPGMMAEIERLADGNKQSVALEIAELSYLQANAMVQKKHKMNPDDKGTD